MRLRSTRCMRYIPPDHEKTARLRGLEVFNGMKWEALCRRLLGNHGDVRVGHDIVVPSICPDELLFVPMHGNHDLATYIEQCALSSTRDTVVDVFADVLGLRLDAESTPAVTYDGVRYDDLVSYGDKIAWMWWDNSPRQDALRRSIIAATVVTTSWSYLVEPLEQLNPNVILLPDCGVTRLSRQIFRGHLDVVVDLIEKNKQRSA